MTGREPGSADFGPTPLTPRRRRVDPAIIGALVVVAAIGLAVLKPWASPVPDDNAARATATGSGAIGDAATAVPAPSSPEAAAIDSTPPIPWSFAADALEPHDGWGVRAIVRGRQTGSGPPGDGPGTGLVERWTELETAIDGTETALLPTADQGVLALGLTFPADELPLDVRILRETDRGWQWLDTDPIGASPAAGAFLYAPPRIGGVARPTWPTGAYRIEVLADHARVRRIDVDLPDRFEVVPGAGFIADETQSGQASPFAPDLGSLDRSGPFVVEGGRAVGLDATAAEALEPAAAWLAAQLVPGGIEPHPVAAVHAPRANGFGYLIAADATDVSAELVRLQPGEALEDVRRAYGVRFAGDHRMPYVIFRAPAGEPWLPGIYRIDVSWSDGDGAHRAAVHVELRPGPFGTQPVILGSLRRLAPAAGREIVAGVSGPSGQPVDLGCTGIRTGETIVSSDPPAVIGLGHPPGEPPTTILAERVVQGSSEFVPLAMAREPIPGLTLLVLAGGDAFPPGVYRLSMTTGDEARVRTICAGVSDLD